MSLNIIFLIIGLVLSVASKLMQFRFKQLEDLGNLIVIPAATFFTLAILFSISQYTERFNSDATKARAIGLAVAACLGVALFQIMTLTLVEKGSYLILLLIIPILVCVGVFFFLWQVA